MESTLYNLNLIFNFFVTNKTSILCYMIALQVAAVLYIDLTGNLIVSAIILIVNFALAAIALFILGYDYFAAILVSVYVGAITVLLLFVIMAIRIKVDNTVFVRHHKLFVGAVIAAILLVIAVLVVQCYPEYLFNQKFHHFSFSKEFLEKIEMSELQRARLVLEDFMSKTNLTRPDLEKICANRKSCQEFVNTISLYVRWENIYSKDVALQNDKIDFYMKNVLHIDSLRKLTSAAQYNYNIRFFLVLVVGILLLVCLFGALVLAWNPNEFRDKYENLPDYEYGVVFSRVSNLLAKNDVLEKFEKAKREREEKEEKEKNSGGDTNKGS